VIPLYEIRLLEDWLRDRAPPWFQNAPVGPEIEAYGALADEHLEYVATALRARYAELAPEDGLNLLGAERNFVRYRAESGDAFRARVLGAWDFWQWGGTEYGMRLWLKVAGYEARIHEHFRDDPSIWAEFSLYLWPYRPEFITDRWDDEVGAWDDGSNWDYTIAGAELQRVPELVKEVKPAHAKIRSIYYVPGPRDVWGDEMFWDNRMFWDDGTLWDDGTVWDDEIIWNDEIVWDDGGVWNPEPVQIYP